MSPPPRRLAVVIPSHDARDLLLECLASLDAAGVAPEQIWVVDDGSRDGTAEAVRDGFPGVGLLVNKRCAGFSAAANRGLRQATGADLLFLLNDDTRVDQDALHQLLRAFEKDPALGVAGAALRFPDGRPQWSGGSLPTLGWLFALASGLPRLLERLPEYRRRHPVVPHSDHGEPVQLDWVTGAALAVRRQVLDQIGYLDEGYAFYCQDLDVCLRARRHGWKVALLPAVGVVHHQGATIGRSPGALDRRQRPDLLWPDLLRWAHRDHGPTWAAFARAALAAGALVRLLVRSAAGPFISSGRRLDWSREGKALRLALRASLWRRRALETTSPH